MDSWERTAKVLLNNAREFLESLRDEIRLNEVTLASLLGVQSTFVLGLADASLYSFSIGLDEVVESSYRLFVEDLALKRVQPTVSIGDIVLAIK
jgi:hypothetical protein